MALARDAQLSGDPVLAENYLQHAEHYNRIIMAYREQMQQSGEINGGQQPSIARFRPGPQDPMGDDFGEGEGDDLAVTARPGVHGARRSAAGRVRWPPARRAARQPAI